MPIAMGIDIGGTKIALGIGDETGRVMAEDQIWTRDVPDPREALDAMGDLAKKVLHQADVSCKEIQAIGVGSPGPLDGGTVLGTSNLAGWHGTDLAEGLSTRLGRPTYVENDATAAGLGEWLFGAGRGSRDMVYVTVSTGIGAGIVAGGAVVSGSHGNAGELGHIVIEPDGPSCPAGHRGCLESLSSGTAIARMGRERQKMSAFLAQRPEIQTKDVFDGAAAGDLVCQDIVARAADTLGRGLSYLVNLCNPELMVLGGGVMTHADAIYRDAVTRALALYSLPDLFPSMTIVPAQLGGEAGLVGALAVAFHHEQG